MALGKLQIAHETFELREWADSPLSKSWANQAKKYFVPSKNQGAMIGRDWKLFEPITLNGLEVRNRIAMLPMANNLNGSVGEVTPKLIDYYEEVAKGGTGLVIVQAAHITGEFGGSRLRIDSDDFIPGLNELAETIKVWGARAAIQIAHRGYLTSSRITADDLDWHRIQKLIEDFGKAAKRAKAAGFEMVEIHGAHGYLIHQFLSVLTNGRSDAYGGTLEKRMTFPIHVYRKVREAVGEDYPISFRLSGEEFIPGGINLDDTKRFATSLEKEGVDLISLSAGKGPETREWVIQPMAFPRGCLRKLAQEVKKSINSPILIAGRINDPVLANSILEEGGADLIGMGRGLIADPYLPEKASCGRLDEIKKCIACNYCHGKRVLSNLPLKCSINPEAGRKRERVLVSAQARKRVLVIGGGPAGMECVHTLNQRGHEVLLFERALHLGGKLRVAALPPHKEELGEFLDFLVKRTRREKVPIFLNHEVNEEIVQDVNPDILIFAAGANAIFPNILGLNGKLCYTAEEVLSQDVRAERIMVLGGGLVGCEVTEFLGLRGKKVTLVEERADIGWDLEPTTRKLLIRRMLEKEPVIHKSTKILKIERGRVFFRDADGNERSSDFDAIVLAVGFSPHNRFIEVTQFPGLQVHYIGDCLTPRGILEAIHEGSRVGRFV